MKSFLLLFLAVSLCLLPLSLPAQPAPPATLPVLGAALGCNGPVHVLRRHGDVILVGGRFDLCGDQPASGIAAWDPQRGRYAAFGAGIAGTVLAIHADQDGIVVAGRFDAAGGQPAAHVARWADGRWTPLGWTLLGEARTLAVYEGSLYVGGEFGLQGRTQPWLADGVHLARWDGSDWQGLLSEADSGLDGAVEDLLVHQGRLMVAGHFSQAGGIASPLVASFDGLVWKSLGGGIAPLVPPRVPPFARRFAVQGETLLLIGSFGITPDFLPRGSLQALIDGRWQRFGAFAGTPVAIAVDGDQIRVSDGLRVIDAISGSILVLGGPQYALLFDAGVLHVAGAPGVLYQNGGNGLQQVVGATASIDPVSGAVLPWGRPRVDGQVLASLSTESGVLLGGQLRADAVLHWDGRRLTPLGQLPPRTIIRALAQYQGQIYAGGEWEPDAAGIPSPYLARWDGTAWHTLDPLPESNGRNRSGRVNLLREVQGDLWVGGLFDAAGAVQGGGILRWNGTQWARLGDGPATALRQVFPGGCGSSGCPRLVPELHSLVQHRGQWYLGGRFNAIDSGPPLTGPLAVWDGEALRPPSPGDLQLQALSGIYSMASHGDELILAPFGDPDDSCSRLLGWDGSVTREFGVLPETGPQALTCPAQPPQLLSVLGELYLSGHFRRNDGSVSWDALVRRDGQQWRPASAGGLAAPARQWPSIDNAGVQPLAGRPGLQPALTSGGALPLHGDSMVAAFAEPVLVSRSQQVPGNGDSGEPVLSRAGLQVAFSSRASNLGNLWSGSERGVFMGPTGAGRSWSASDLVLRAGLAAPGTDFAAPSLSHDGDVVAFEGSNGQIYAVRANRPMLLSRRADGSAASGRSQHPAVSPDGRFVAFASDSGDLAGGGPAGSAIHLLDLDSGERERIAVPGAGRHDRPALGDDGVLAFRAVVAGVAQIHLSRRSADGRQTLLLSQRGGVPGNADSDAPRISADGRHGGFASSASNLVISDHNAASDIFVFSVAEDGDTALRRVSVSSAGIEADGPSHAPTLSDDGAVIAFSSLAGNLAAEGRASTPAVYLHLLASGETRRIDLPGVPGQPTLSPDGTVLGLVSALPEQPAQVHYLPVAQPRRHDGLQPGPLPLIERRLLPEPLNGDPLCPGGFYIAEVSDGDGAGLRAGHWGMELLLHEPGKREFAGGVSFGAQVDALQPAFAAFNFTNAANEPQRVDLDLSGVSASNPGQPLRVDLVLRRPGDQRELLQAGLLLDLGRPVRRSLLLQPGFYVIELYDASGDAVGGAAAGQVLVSAFTNFADRPGGGFQGGIVVGGYHGDASVFGSQAVSGFAAFCAPKPERATLQLRNLAENGFQAEDLRLVLRNRERDVLLQRDSR